MTSLIIWKESEITQKRNGEDLPSARKVSNFLNQIEGNTNASVNHMFTQWGQYIIHDIVHTPETNGSNIKCPCGQKSGMTSTRSLNNNLYDS